MAASCINLCLPLIFNSLALATQGHSGIEGVYVHQMAHLFFAFSMGLFIYWLRLSDLTLQPGWHLIQYSALFFLFWNIETLCVHFLEEQIEVITTSHMTSWTIKVVAPPDYGWLSRFYYLIKLDHLLCVPAMLFLYMGLKRLLNTQSTDKQEKTVT